MISIRQLVGRRTKQSNNLRAYVWNCRGGRRTLQIEVSEPNKNANETARGQENGIIRWRPMKLYNVGDGVWQFMGYHSEVLVLFVLRM